MRREPILAVMAMVMAGCATVGPVSSPPYYPSNPSAVLLEHKGDLRATASASLGGETVTAAYALTQHFGVLASGSASLHKSSDPSGNQYSSEIGAGLFDTLTSSHLYGEIYGGIGWGGGSSSFQTGYSSLIPEFAWRISGNEQTRFIPAWMQAAAGYNRNNLALIILLRISDVDIYHDVRHETVMGAGLDNYGSAPYDTTVAGSGTIWTIVPGFEVRYGLNHIQFIASVFETALAPGNSMKSLFSSGLSYQF